MDIKIIINPKSKNGKNKEIKSVLREKLRRFNYNPLFVYSQFPGHATILAKQAIRENYNVVIAVGGDGTINEIINGIASSDVALGIIPTGTANDLASFYQIPSDIKDACDIINKNVIQKIDLIKVNEWYYSTAGGCGLPCAVTEISEKFKSTPFIGKLITQLLGSKIYILALVCAYVKSRTWKNRINIKFDHSNLQANPLFFMINNQPFLGKNFHIAPGAKNNDGIFDVCLAEKSDSHIKNFSVLIQTLFGKHIFSPRVSLWQDSDITISSDNPFHIMGDGELQIKNYEFRIQCIPASLNLIVPKTDSNCKTESTLEKILHGEKNEVFS